LFSSLPWGSEAFGDKAIFVPLDMKERTLKGMLAHNRSHILTVEREHEDPYTFLMNVLDADWEKTHGAKTIILDTMTNWAHQTMEAVLNSGAYKSHVIQMGPSSLKMSDESHYGLVHKLTKNVVMKMKQSPLNVMALFWSDWQTPKTGEPGGIYGGPVTVNMTMAKYITGEFDNVFYLRTQPDGAKLDYYVHTAAYGFWEAKLHGGGLQNPMPVTKLEGDPVHFWKMFEEVQSR
jgi:hypothetical protein